VNACRETGAIRAGHLPERRIPGHKKDGRQMLLEGVEKAGSEKRNSGDNPGTIKEWKKHELGAAPAMKDFRDMNAWDAVRQGSIFRIRTPKYKRIPKSHSGPPIRDKSHL